MRGYRELKSVVLARWSSLRIACILSGDVTPQFGCEFLCVSYWLVVLGLPSLSRTEKNCMYLVACVKAATAENLTAKVIPHSRVIVTYALTFFATRFRVVARKVLLHVIPLRMHALVSSSKNRVSHQPIVHTLLR